MRKKFQEIGQSTVGHPQLMVDDFRVIMKYNQDTYPVTPKLRQFPGARKYSDRKPPEARAARQASALSP